MAAYSPKNYPAVMIFDEVNEPTNLSSSVLIYHTFTSKVTEMLAKTFLLALVKGLSSLPTDRSQPKWS
jgi:hypothetical protein